MNNFEKYTFIKEKLNAPRFNNEDEEIEWFTKHLYGLYNQASRLREENNNYIARIDKYKEVLDKIDKLINTDYGWVSYYYKYNNRYLKSEIKEDINKLLEEIE